ncbi:OLC1v1023813C1 [Oldenlandia corymbosa var. corymbosa]|uniref:OLC1v1023813C1 n=1 Tax=Oldenlandia corymbosa var. corymbosa TaxID=529605 RepID=A0AAV1C178_OLDCO|nr:OLC1v1023813C1 [Oldenlandia corymbosa var. corymbosa]
MAKPTTPLIFIVFFVFLAVYSKSASARILGENAASVTDSKSLFHELGYDWSTVNLKNMRIFKGPSGPDSIHHDSPSAPFRLLREVPSGPNPLHNESPPKAPV